MIKRKAGIGKMRPKKKEKAVSGALKTAHDFEKEWRLLFQTALNKIFEFFLESRLQKQKKSL